MEERVRASLEVGDGIDVGWTNDRGGTATSLLTSHSKA